MEWNSFLSHRFSNLLVALPGFPSGGDKTQPWEVGIVLLHFAPNSAKINEKKLKIHKFDFFLF